MTPQKQIAVFQIENALDIIDTEPENAKQYLINALNRLELKN